MRCLEVGLQESKTLWNFQEKYGLQISFLPTECEHAWSLLLQTTL